MLVVGARFQRQVVPAYAFAHAAKKLCRLGRIRVSAPNLLEAQRRAIETADIDERLCKIEEAQAGR
jgi:hypothetical protein